MIKFNSFIIAFLFFLLINKNASSQSFLNGSFEINTSPPCNFNMSNASYNATMSNTTAFGSGHLNIYDASGSCLAGSPECGNWFVGLTFNGTSDAFTMDLSAPLVAGSSHTISFWDKGDASLPPGMPVIIGLSAVPGAAGTTIYTGPVPTQNIWTQRIFNFVAPNNGMYISVRTAGPSQITHVDDFKLDNIGNTVTSGPIQGNTFCTCAPLMVQFTSAGTYNSGNVYSVILSNPSGNLFVGTTTIGSLTSTSNHDSIACVIPCNAVPSSSYLIQVVSSNPINGTVCSGTLSVVPITINPSPSVTVNSATICPGQTANLVANGAVSYTWSAGATATGVNTADASPVVTSSYTVTGTSGGGCSDTAISTVTIGGALTINVNSPTICPGATANLTASGATSYTWSAGATSTGVNTADASPIITTTYTVTGNTGPCIGTAVATVTVTSALPVSVNSPTICTGQTANLTATGATNYIWTAGATSTGINTADASPLVTTTYTVNGTSGVCTGSAVATVTVNVTPVVTVNSPTICSGQIANLTASGANSYAWTTGITPTGLGTGNAFPVSTTSYTVTGTSLGCIDSAIATVTVNTTPSVSVNPATICPGATASLTATGATSYVWSAGANPTGINTADASPIITTTYTVTGTTGTCSDTASAIVTVTAGLPVTVNSLTICAGQMASLIAGGATNYTWSSGVTPTGTTTGDASPLVTTSYTVTGTTGVCTGSAVSVVTVNPLPIVGVNSSTICSGQTAILNASGATSYTWSAGAISSGISSANASPVITTTYTVTGTTNSCVGSAIATVTVNSTPLISVNSPTICSGQTANLVATGGATYTWTSGAVSTGGGNATASPLTTASYTVTGTTNGCSNTAVSAVTVNQTPLVTFSSNSLTICNGQTATLTANGAASYSWSSGATSAGGNTATASPVLTTNYTVTGTTNGCSSTAVATINVQNCPPPTANFSASPLVLCDSGCVNFTDLSTDLPTSWLWQFPGGTPSSSTLQNPPTICYNVLGQYSVILIATNAQGSDTLVKTAYISIVSPIQVSITGSTTINACESAHLVAEPEGNSYLWGPNYGLSCSNCQEAIVSPLFTQDYYCEYTDINGCYSTDTTTVNVTQLFTYFMPTAFSPNSDRVNDILFVYGKGVDKIYLVIYNRVGQKVFETDNIEAGWDGTFNGKPLNNDAFVYILEVTYCNGQTVKEHGSLMLTK